MERLDEPWPIRNALAKLTESRDRARHRMSELAVLEHRSPAQDITLAKQETIMLALDYAMEVVKGINTLKPPERPTPGDEFRALVQKAAEIAGQAIENFGAELKYAGSAWKRTYDYDD